MSEGHAAKNDAQGTRKKNSVDAITRPNAPGCEASADASSPSGGVRGIGRKSVWRNCDGESWLIENWTPNCQHVKAGLADTVGLAWLINWTHAAAGDW